MSRLQLQDDRHCFVCGEKNPIGLKLKFTLDGDSLKTEFTPEKSHQGYQDIVHGGIIGLILDEVMVNLLWKTARPAVSAEIKLKLKKPVKVGQTLYFASRIKEENSRIIYTEAQAKDRDGQLVAEAEAKCVRIKR